MTGTTALVADALRAAGHAESATVGGKLTTGFSVFMSGSRALVVAISGDDAEGHFDSPGRLDMKARMADGYAKALDAAGWATEVRDRSASVAVFGRKAA